MNKATMLIRSALAQRTVIKTKAQHIWQQWLAEHTAQPPPKPPPKTPGKINLVKSALTGRPRSLPVPQAKDEYEKMLGALAHVIAAIGPLLPPHWSLMAIIPPLVFWLAKRDDGPYFAEVGKECINFQINVGVLIFVLAVLSALPFIGSLFFLVMTAAYIGAAVLMLMGAVEMKQGKFYRYPWIIRLLE